nr:response regulator [Cohnella lubricantis]
MIADDEILVRVGLKTIIPWEQHGFELIGEASNGLETLEILRREPCHILLTDIRMPHCDGLAVIEQLRDLSPSTKCLILSSHNDFEYVRKALQLGAADYVLKLTMEPEELLEKLIALKGQIIRDNEKLMEASEREYKMSVYSKEAKESRLRDLLVKDCSVKDIEDFRQEFDLQLGEDEPPIYYVVNLQLDKYQEALEENRFQSERLLNFTVKNILVEILKKYAQGEFAEIGGGEFSLVTAEDPRGMLDEMGAAVNTFLRLSMSAGISAQLERLQDLHAGYLQAEEALQERFYEGYGSINEYQSLRYAASSKPAGEPSAASWIEDEWFKLLELRDSEAVRQKLGAWYEVSREEREHPELLREQWVQLVHVFGQYAAKLRGDLYSIPLYDGMYPLHAVRSLQTLQDIYGWFTGWVQVYLDYTQQLAGTQWRPEIQTAAAIISERYRDNLKVSELAREVGFTENYLSVLFKKETGETIMDYLTRIRMDRARELLKDQAYKIYEVSEQVGYSDANYFSKLFKRMEGVYPLEFRKLALGRTPTSKNKTVS